MGRFIVRAGSTHRASDRAWLLGVLAIAILLTIVATRWTFDMWTWQNDEFLFRQTARWIGDNLPSSLWAVDEYTRGVQRLNAWLLAFSLDVFGSPAGFRFARWVIVLAFASTVVPVWLLARTAGAERVWAAIAALGAVLVPWAALTGTFLTEGFAYPLLGWALLAIYATVARPSLRGDVVALAAIGAAMFARTGLVLLVVALGVAVVGQELRLAGSPRDVLRVPLRLARRHTLLVVVGVAGLLVLATGHSGTLKGSWYSNAGPRWGETWHGLLYVISSVSTGVGFVPAIAALAYAGTQIWRPRSQTDLALAWIVVGVLATFTLTLISGPIEERYVFYWALPCAVALAVAASRRSASIPGIVLAAALVLVAMGDRMWRVDVFGFSGYQLFPAELFQARVIRLGITDRLPGALDLSGGTVSALVVIGAALVTALIAAPFPRRASAPAWMRPVALGLGCAVLFAGAVQVGWAMHKYVGLDGGGRDLTARTTIERRADGHRVGLWLPPAPPGAASPAWQELRYYSPDVRGLYRLGAAQDAPLFTGEAASPVTIDEATGRVKAVTPGERLPGLMAVVAGQASAPLRGRVLAEDRGLGIDLVRPSTPLSVRWSSGPSLDGTIDGHTTQTIRVFPPFASGSCLELDATLLERRRGEFTARVPGRGGSVTYATQSRPVTLSAPLRDGKATDVQVSLAPRGGRGVRAGLLGRVVPVRVAQCDAIEAEPDVLTVELPDAPAAG